VKSAVQSLSKWYLRQARALPWRENHDPYRIWISEVMLQQTQVATVIPYYHRFLKELPTLEALAAAPTEKVLQLWSGLGYYSRARNLQKGAQYLVEKYAGKFPRMREEIEEVPGIGPYTAGAILSIAFDLPEALVDGNVQRVFARYFGIQAEIEQRETQRLFWQHAATWVKAAEAPRVLNQALMELGAMICTKGTPKCDLCPLAQTCVARAKGWQEELPRRKARRKAVDLWWQGFVVEKKGKIFLRQNQKGEWWTDLWDFPTRPLTSREVWEKPPAFEARRLAPQKHTVTHHRIHIAPYHHAVSRKPPFELGPGRWVSVEEAQNLPLSSLARKVLQAYLC